MQCDKFDNQINELLDRRDHPLEDAGVTAHAEDCDRCRRRLDGCVAMLDGMSLPRLPQFRDDFSAKVVSEVAAPQVEVDQRDGRHSSSWMIRLLAVAALVLIVAIPAAIYSLRTESGGVADNQEPNGDTSREDVTDDLPKLAVEDDDAPNEDQIATTDDDEALEEMVVRLREAWPEVRQSIMTDNLAAAPITELQDGFVDHVSVPLRPLAVSVTGTINIVRDTFSRGVSQQPSDKPQADVRWFDGLPSLSHTEISGCCPALWA